MPFFQDGKYRPLQKQENNAPSLNRFIKCLISPQAPVLLDHSGLEDLTVPITLLAAPDLIGYM